MEGSNVPRDETDSGRVGLRDETDSARVPAVPALADPAPLGLAAFATTTFILSMINANFVGGGVATAAGIVAGMAFAYGGIAQFAAGLWEFRNGNTFGATAFCSFGMFWLSFYLLLHVTASSLPKTEADSAIGLYLWAWAIFTAYMTIASLRTTGAVFAVFLLLTITFIFLGIGNSALSGTLNDDQQRDQDRRLCRPGDRGRCLVRVGRWRDQRHLGPGGAPGVPADSELRLR